MEAQKRLDEVAEKGKIFRRKREQERQEEERRREEKVREASQDYGSPWTGLSYLSALASNQL